MHLQLYKSAFRKKNHTQISIQTLGTDFCRLQIEKKQPTCATTTFSALNNENRTCCCCLNGAVQFPLAAILSSIKLNRLQLQHSFPFY